MFIIVIFSAVLNLSLIYNILSLAAFYLTSILCDVSRAMSRVQGRKETYQHTCFESHAFT